MWASFVYVSHQFHYLISQEAQSQKLNFSDVTIINTGTGKYEFKMYHKNEIKNVQIKPHLFVNPSIMRGIFKGFVSRAKRLCFEKYLNEELNSLIDMFLENEYDRNFLDSIIKENKHQAPKTQKTDSNIVKLPWLPTIGP